MSTPATNVRCAQDDASPEPLHWTTPKRRRAAWTVTILLLFLMMLNWADKAVIGLAAIPLMQDLGVTPQQFGLVNSGMFLAFMVAQIVIAPVSTRLPARWMIMVMCGIWALSNLPVVLVATLPALWVSRLLLGAGEGPYAPIAMHATYKWFPKKKGATPAALVSAGVTLGIVTFAPLLAWVIATWGWKIAFLSLSVAGMIWMLAWFFVGKEGPYTSDAAELAMEGDSSCLTSATPAQQKQAPCEDRDVPFFRTILNPTWFFAVFVSFMGYFTFALATSWAPAYFESVLGYSRQTAGSLIALPAAWGFLATIGLSNLTQRLDLRGVPTRIARGVVVGGAGFLAGLSLLASTFVENPALALALMTIGFGTAPALFAVTYLIVAELTSVRQRPAHLNIANAGLSLGGVVAPSVAGWLIGNAAAPAQGYIQSFQIAGALLALGGVACMLFVNQQRQRRSLGLDGVSDPTPAHGTSLR